MWLMLAGTPVFIWQTNFIVSAQGIPVNIKKGQFLAFLALQVANKAKSTGNQQIMVCERGASFGYNNLVRYALAVADAATGCPVVGDATHGTNAR